MGVFDKIVKNQVVRRYHKEWLTSSKCFSESDMIMISLSLHPFFCIAFFSCTTGPKKTVQSIHSVDGAFGQVGVSGTQYRINVLLRGQVDRSTIANMLLFLLTIGLTLTAVKGLFNEPKCATIDKLLGNWYIVRWAGNLPLPESKLRCPLPPFVLAKNRIGYLEFRMNISKPIGCVEFKMAMNEAKDKPCYFTLWMWHYVIIQFIGGENFALAHIKSSINDVVQLMAMLMGRRNHFADSTLLLDFETLVVGIGLNKTSIINPPYDDSCELNKES
nr:uncharacterized protein LOC110541067 [Meriones unguiculatus]